MEKREILIIGAPDNFVGKVFSDALGDAWVDVEQLTILKKAPEEKSNGEK